MRALFERRMNVNKMIHLRPSNNGMIEGVRWGSFPLDVGAKVTAVTQRRQPWCSDPSLNFALVDRSVVSRWKTKSPTKRSFSFWTSTLQCRKQSMKRCYYVEINHRLSYDGKRKVICRWREVFIVLKTQRVIRHIRNPSIIGVINISRHVFFLRHGIKSMQCI